MKKKLFALLLVLCFCVSIFTGCSLVETNQKAAAESVVATISYSDGTSEDITRQELQMAYNSFGYNYVQNYGMSLDEALSTTLNSVVDNKLLARAVKEELGDEYLDAHEKTYLWDLTYDSIVDNLDGYRDNKVSEGEAEEENPAVFKDYEKKAKLVKTPVLDEQGKQKVDENGDLIFEYSIQKIVPQSTIRGNYVKNGIFLDVEKKEDKELLFKQLQSVVANNDYSKAYGEYIKAIKKNYSYLDFKTNDEWFMFEIERIYGILKDNFLVEKFDTTFDNRKTDKSTATNVTVKAILDSYASNVRADYTKYMLENGDFNTDVVSDFANMDYFKSGVDVFNLAYIKFNFSETQTKQLEELEKYKNTYDEQGYETKENGIYKSTMATSKLDETKRNAYAVVDELSSLMKNQPEQTKIEKFRDYMFEYSDDTTLNGAETNPAFAFAGDEYLASSTFSGEDFEEAIRKLYNDGKAKVGDMSEVVKGEDGLYVFFYAGKVSNLFGYVNEKFTVLRPENIEILDNTKLNVFSEKTLFDKLYESLESDEYSEFRTYKLNEMKSEKDPNRPDVLTCVVTTYPKNFR